MSPNDAIKSYLDRFVYCSIIERAFVAIVVTTELYYYNCYTIACIIILWIADSSWLLLQVFIVYCAVVGNILFIVSSLALFSNEYLHRYSSWLCWFISHFGNSKSQSIEKSFELHIKVPTFREISSYLRYDQQSYLFGWVLLQTYLMVSSPIANNLVGLCLNNRKMFRHVHLCYFSSCL